MWYQKNESAIDLRIFSSIEFSIGVPFTELTFFMVSYLDTKVISIKLFEIVSSFSRSNYVLVVIPDNIPYDIAEIIKADTVLLAEQTADFSNSIYLKTSCLMNLYDTNLPFVIIVSNQKSISAKFVDMVQELKSCTLYNNSK
ncbi:uncharacterized protein EV154DRAFT_479521 [Mucor mucedo]|uniref:uncharacterized protein n=1 Tax=Mucor mucedo TaxID=29922 RepID=UPI002220101A|nr:uncharacterized protein EV154DRAFT_479521 [Mucor mucedo]KAI7893296.1 hypothetical protein EV154DRAFT_479521 [Mucor mucedo]